MLDARETALVSGRSAAEQRIERQNSMKFLDILGAFVAVLLLVLAVGRALRYGVQSVRDEAVAAGVAEYRLDSPSDQVAKFHWRTNRP